MVGGTEQYNREDGKDSGGARMRVERLQARGGNIRTHGPVLSSHWPGISETGVLPPPAKFLHRDFALQLRSSVRIPSLPKSKIANKQLFQYCMYRRTL